MKLVAEESDDLAHLSSEVKPAIIEEQTLGHKDTKDFYFFVSFVFFVSQWKRQLQQLSILRTPTH